MKKFLKQIEGALIVSCTADKHGGNEEMAYPQTNASVAMSSVSGGAKAIRTNLENIPAVRKAVDVPIIGIKKIYQNENDYRITPTLKEVESLIQAGADAVAIDGTSRSRYDSYTLQEFIKEIKKRFDTIVIADVSTAQEGILAWEYGADLIGTTLSGYTSYSENPIEFGALPSPDPDYEIIKKLVEAGVKYVIAEGRITDGKKLRKALDAGACCAVVGTSITQPSKIVKTILMEANID